VLAEIVLADAANGRIDDDAWGQPASPRPGVEALAAALAKAGNVPSALQTAAQIGDPMACKSLAIAQALPQQ
jgi:hypothetical protein